MPQNPLALLREMFKAATDQDDAWSRQDANRGIFGDHFDETRLPPHMVYNGPDLPPVSRAPGFRKPTEVVGGPEFAREVERFFNIVPEMRGIPKKVIHGPNETAFRELRQGGLNDNDYANSNMAGQYTKWGPNAKEITISPGFDLTKPYDLQDFRDTLAHEMGHAAGYGHGPQMEQIEQLSVEEDPRLVELLSVDIDKDGWQDGLPQPTPPKLNLPETLRPQPYEPGHDDKFYQMLMEFGELNRKRFQGAKHLVNEKWNPWK